MFINDKKLSKLDFFQGDGREFINEKFLSEILHSEKSSQIFEVIKSRYNE